MCLPQPPAKPFPSREKRERKPKKHTDFDRRRMKPDPDFVDERKSADPEPKRRTFLEKLFSLIH